MQQHRRLRARIQALLLCLGAVSALTAVPLAAQSRHFVYLASGADHAVSGFELIPASGTLTAIAGPPINNGLDPGTMTLHPSGRFLYVLNAGAKSVSAFAVDPVTGVLTEVLASPFADVGPVGSTPKMLLVESSGNSLYVVSTLDGPSGTDTPIYYYALDQATGAPKTPASTFTLGSFGPAGFVSAPGVRFLYLVGTATASGSSVSIRTIELDPATGEIANVVALSGRGQFAHSAAISPNGQFLFVGRGLSTGSIDTYRISADGSLQDSINTFPLVGTSALPHSLAVDASGTYLYAAVGGEGIRGFSVTPGTGELTALPGFPISGLAVSPSSVMVADAVEQFLYFEQRPFAISDQGALDGLPAFSLTVGGNVTGIVAANPLDDVQAISAPVVALAPSSLQFTDQYVGADSEPRQVSLSNTGNAPLVLSSDITVTGINSSEFGLWHDCLAVLQPSNGCTITITFQPMFEGVRQAALTVLDNASGSPHTVELTGLGLLPFTIQLDSSTASVIAGQMAEYNLRLVPTLDFAGQVALFCSGAPTGAACNIPPSLQLNGTTPTLFVVSVPTTARSVILPLARPFHPGVGTGHSSRILVWGAVLTLLCLLLPHLWPTPVAVFGPQFKIHCAIVLVLVWVSLGLMSCGRAATATTSISFPAATGTPAGQYQLTLTAASGSATQTIPLSLAVQ